MPTLAKSPFIKLEDYGPTIQLEQTTYALNATTIDLSLSLVPWATFRKNKGAVKLHALLDLKGNLPTVAFIANGKVHGVNILDKLPIETGAIYIMDRGYLDYVRLYRLHQVAANFVTRAKSNARYDHCHYHKIDKTAGLRLDQVVTLHGYYTRKAYPERLRRIAYYEGNQSKKLIFLTKNFTLPALTITEIRLTRNWTSK
ncbi:MAG: transposase [Fibrobacter sp.]|nr:transposase [Fibrobacter sp.]